MTFLAQLSSMEDWLYDEGEDESKKVYTERLAELRKVGDPVVERQIESMNRPAAFDALGRTIVHYEKIVAAYDSGVCTHTYTHTHTLMYKCP